MPCDSIPAAFPQRFVAFRCAPAAPWPSLGRLAGLPSDLRRISRGEKIPHGGWPAVFPAAAKTSNGRGEGCKEPRRRGPGLPRAQASADFFRDQRRRSDLFLLISAAVLRLWQLWHKLCRLLASVNTAQSPLWSRMWSTSVALVRMPCWAHSRHHGSRRSCSLRSVFQSCVPYIQRQACASWLRSLSFGWCSAQYPPGTSR